MKTQVFPYAPKDWNQSVAESIAAEDNLVLTDDHWILIQCLQEYYERNDFPKLRIVTDALEEKFHSKGGMKYLYLDGRFSGFVKVTRTDAHIEFFPLGNLMPNQFDILDTQGAV